MAEQITFDRDLYPLPAVEAAVAAYAHLAVLQLESDEGKVRVRMTEVPDDDPGFTAQLVDELCNHALYEAVRLHRAGVPA